MRGGHECWKCSRQASLLLSLSVCIVLVVDIASEQLCPVLLAAFPVQIACAHSGTITTA